MAGPRQHRPRPPAAPTVALCLLALCGLLLVGRAGAQGRPAAAVMVAAPPPTTTLAPEGAAAPGLLMLELSRPPAALAALRAEALGVAEPAAASRAQLAAIAHEQGRVAAALAAMPAVEVLYSVRNAYNGIAVRAEGPAAAARLAALPGVRAVRPMAAHERGNATSVALVGAPRVWGGAGGLTGAGVTIGIIDTGIDYLHAAFGGPGTYAGSDPTVITDAPSAAHFGPGTKVAGGYDFVGDAYNGANAAARDPDPLDCPTALGGGHGTHVAATAAGLGVRSDGAPYAGPYDAAADLEALRIGPGVAPGATLYALRVFGCTGSTAYTVAAVDWALDPNGDGDLADRLDVLNLSLGSPFGTADDPSVAAINTAVAAGVVAVVSAGNSGDVYYIGGTPGSAEGAITVANSVDAGDLADGFRVENTAIAGVKPAGFSINFDWAASAPRTASLVYPAVNTTGCAAYSGADAALVSGRVVLVDWAPAGTSDYPCSSAVRANFAAAAGAAGIIMASGQGYFDGVIGGNATIRALFTTGAVGQQLKSVLTQGADTGVTVTLSGAFRSYGLFKTPAAEDLLNFSSSRGPQGLGGALKPDVTAPGTSIFSASSGSGSQGRTLTGTSMAAPHVAGLAALLRQQRPALSPAELKAIIVNTAAADLFTGMGRTGARYGPARVGAGRVDAERAAAAQVIAYAAAAPRAVSVSFGAVQILGSAALTRSVTVRNLGAADATYAVGYDARTDIPGVSYSFPDGPAVTAPAGGAASFRVVLRATADEMRHVRDGSVAATQGGLARHWLSEESGLITLTPAAGPALRVPVYATARPAADLASAAGALAFGSPTGTGAITLTGTALRPWQTAAQPAEQVALVTALELQHTSPATTTAGLSHADLRYVGVGSDAAAIAARGGDLATAQLLFGIATWGDWSRPVSELQFNIYLDRDRDGISDITLTSTALATSNGAATDLFVAAVGPAAVSYLNGQMADAADTAVYNTNVVVLAAPAASLGLAMGGATARFDYWVEAVRARFGVVETTPTLTYDARNPGLDFTGGQPGAVSWRLNAGDSIPASYNQAAYQANGSTGALLLHHFNLSGRRAEVLPVGLAQTVSLSAPAGKVYGDEPFAVAAASSAGLPVAVRSATPAVCAVAGEVVRILGAGTCRLTASQQGGGGYLPASAGAAVAVGRAPLTIRADDVARRAGADNPAFTASYRGLVNGDGPGALDAPPELSTPAGRLSAPGPYPIVVAGAADANYAIAYEAGTLTVTGGLSFLPLLRR